MLFASAAAAEPFRLTASNTLDVLNNLRGGIKAGTRALNKTDVSAGLVGSDEVWPGWQAFVHAQWTHSNEFSGTLVGDSQVISNIDAPQGFRAMNAWISREFSAGAGFKLGILDLNTEFDVQNVGALFLNASNGIGPDFSQTGENGPSIFPATGLAAVGWMLPTENWVLKAGIFEGTAGDPGFPGRSRLNLSHDEGILLAFESRLQITPGVNLGVGGWHYTSDFSAIGSTVPVYGNSGFYGVAEATLVGNPEGERLDGWIRAGLANARINPIRSYAGGGLVYSAPFGRENDALGLAVSHIHFGEPARLTAGLSNSETVFELTYAFSWGENIAVQPDLQYIINPGGVGLRNAMIAGARFVLTFP